MSVLLEHISDQLLVIELTLICILFCAIMITARMYEGKK